MVESDELAFPFTERDTPALRARIRSDLREIAERARRADPALHALLLTGGFSRGEGTAREEVPLNDYDLVAVRSRPGGRARYRRLGLELSRRVGLEVDLLPVWRARLPRVGAKLFWLDAKLGARTIWGDASALRELRPLQPGDLPPLEAARLLGNRAAGLLLALPGRADEPVDLHQRNLQSVKAILAAMDASLLTDGGYAPRLRDRLALSARYPGHPLYSAAVQWKLGGCREVLPDDIWHRAAQELLRAVERTGARAAPDGWPERLYHLATARRLAASPSRTIRETAWALLEGSRWPDGPDPALAGRLLGSGGTWATLKTRFFERRARTLQ